MSEVSPNWGFSGPVVSTGYDGHNVRLYLPLAYTAKDGTLITIPLGDDSDGASTPPYIWTIIPPFGWYYRATWLHDHGYRHQFWPREYTDNLLLEAMEWCLIDAIKRGAINANDEAKERLVMMSIYEGVRLGGQAAYNEDQLALWKRTKAA